MLCTVAIRQKCKKSDIQNKFVRTKNEVRSENVLFLNYLKKRTSLYITTTTSEKKARSRLQEVPIVFLLDSLSKKIGTTCSLATRRDPCGK